MSRINNRVVSSRVPLPLILHNQELGAFGAFRGGNGSSWHQVGRSIIDCMWQESVELGRLLVHVSTLLLPRVLGC